MALRMDALVCALVAVGGSLPALGQPAQTVLGEDTIKVSEHVWAIMGFPNVAIVTGERATLVVDTGLGPRNGATVARVAAKLGPRGKLFLATTHFHPEHAAGDAGFPPETILVRNAVQQKEMESDGARMIQMFSTRSAQNQTLLADVKLRAPDILFDSEIRIDLGGTSARVLWFGAAHTKGDQVVLVEPDQTLISGDVVQNQVVPNIVGGGTFASWIAVLDKIAALPVRYVLPDHSAPGDGPLVGQEKAFIVDARTRALALKAQGVSAEDAAKMMNEELKGKYPWPNLNVTGMVRAVYAE